ncbi:hypothetical protein [Salinispora pacifica]|uniref:hypothetical protein n=1 Tax=Salinispora pacifica TaxID=351187 RepID=UPI0004854EA3|nr:hypothetical protein [Salinispora pacifica]
MGLTPPAAGLKRLRHNAISPTRVEVTVPAGDELEVSDAVAAQLRAADPHFQPADKPAADTSTAPADKPRARKAQK